MSPESAESDALSFLTERDKDAIWREAKFAGDYGAGDLYRVIDDIVARHVGRAVTRPISDWDQVTE